MKKERSQIGYVLFVYKESEKYMGIAICCPKCKSKLGTHDGRSTIPKVIDCKKCDKRVVYHVDSGEIEIKDIPPRNTASGKRF